MLNDVAKAHTVVAILQAAEGKEEALKQALIEVIEPSRKEKQCIEYKLHQDKNNPGQFILYENWQSAEGHVEQFKKPYITALAEQLKELLAKPYQVFFATELP
ncbi:MAG: antibiotic biosynthesis monooxygenase [Legionella sp.]|nr:MAG: antibiotic biosynthesis monooxygenase [Legionella sp.]